MSHIANFLFLLFSVSILSITQLSAQQLKHVPGDLLIQLRPGFSPEDLQTATLRSTNQSTVLHFSKQLLPDMPIYKFQFDPNRWNEIQVLQELRQHPAVEFAQFNHIIELRNTEPDDELFSSQWQYVNSNGIDLDMEQAWEYTTGGVTPLGDTIVVCVIDEGFDADHPDLAPNVWFNRYEIPDNGIDDDNNGYVDDFNGWNIFREDDDIDRIGIHGTSVAAIVGAKGNNQIGVAGVNWDVKLMLVIGVSGREEDVLASYGMPLSHRKLYQQTNGQRGHFVVATNASWGVDDLFPEDAPIWCALYDTLGHYGILNVAATANSNIDVDLEGDLPTTCPSDFLIGVTNVDSTGQKLRGAGYGKQSIDLGSFGHQVFTAFDNATYRRFFGTSGAAPHVAGAIALMYSADCEQLNLLARNNPSEAAIMIRENILQGVVPANSLDTTTVTGGYLNILNSLNLLLGQCETVSTNQPKPEASFELYPNPVLDNLTIEVDQLSTIRIFSATGQLLTEQKLSSRIQQIQMEDKVSGIYFLEIEQEDGRSIEKVIKM